MAQPTAGETPGSPRIAVYYAPLPEDPLTTLGNTWLGRDPATGAPVPQLALADPAVADPAVADPALADPAVADPAVANPTLADIKAITAEPRRYGFHATLKPPMQPAAGATWNQFMAAVSAIAATIGPFDLPPLEVQDLRGFLALRETAACPPLQALADACVERLDGFRAPPSESELARRRAARLTPEQEALLRRWGYPYVFGSWFFHMTLTRRLSDAEKAGVMPAAKAYFAPALELPRRVSDLCVFTQAAPDAAFTIAERVRLRG